MFAAVISAYVASSSAVVPPQRAERVEVRATSDGYVVIGVNSGNVHRKLPCFAESTSPLRNADGSFVVLGCREAAVLCLSPYGKTIWTRQLDSYKDPEFVAFRGHHLAYSRGDLAFRSWEGRKEGRAAFSEEDRICKTECLNSETGQLLWSSKVSTVGKPLVFQSRDKFLTFGPTSPLEYYLSKNANFTIRLVDVATGKVIHSWPAPQGTAKVWDAAWNVGLRVDTVAEGTWRITVTDGTRMRRLLFRLNNRTNKLSLRRPAIARHSCDARRTMVAAETS